MKYLSLLLIALAGCSSPGPQYKQQDLVVDKFVQSMSRTEIISAVQECEGNGLNANMVYAKRQVNGFSVNVVIDVICTPKYKFF